MNPINESIKFINQHSDYEILAVSVSEHDERLVDFLLVYVDSLNQGHSWTWRCHAESTDHAIEQLKNDQPEVTVTLVLPYDVYKTLQDIKGVFQTFRELFVEP
jgi:hypothetical protein